MDDYDPWEDECDDGSYFDPENDCPTCQGEGRVPTLDIESYLGAQYKPCPTCHGNLCVEQPELS